MFDAFRPVIFCTVFVVLSGCENLLASFSRLDPICRNPIIVTSDQNLPAYRNARRGDLEICNGETVCSFIVAMRTAEFCTSSAPQTILLAPGSVHVLDGNYRGTAGGLVKGDLTITSSAPGKAPEIRHANSAVPLFKRSGRGAITLDGLKITGTNNQPLVDNDSRSFPSTLKSTELSDMDSPGLDRATVFEPVLLRNIRGVVRLTVQGANNNAVIENNEIVALFVDGAATLTDASIRENDTVSINISQGEALEIAGNSRIDNNSEISFYSRRNSTVQLSNVQFDGNTKLKFETGDQLSPIFSKTLLDNVVVTNTDEFLSKGGGFGAEIKITDSQFRDVKNLQFSWFGGDAQGLNEITRSSFVDGSSFSYESGYPSEIQTTFSTSTISGFSRANILVTGEDGSPSSIRLQNMTFARNGSVGLQANGNASISAVETLFFAPNGSVSCREDENPYEFEDITEGTILIGETTIGPTSSSCDFQRKIDQPDLSRRDNGAHFMPQANSPAVNTGNATCPSPDQLGRPRPVGAACDIGAVERP